MAIEPDLLKRAVETYNLELALTGGLSTDALETAISAALEAHELTVLRRISSLALVFAHAPGEGREQAGAVLQWFAGEITREIPPPDEYVPGEEDLVEVSLTGRVACFSHDDEDYWSIVDDTTGEEYFFDTDQRTMPRVRVLIKNETEE